MEFFIDTMTFIAAISAFILGYMKGKFDAKKKFQVEHETSKVSINKDDGSLCRNYTSCGFKYLKDKMDCRHEHFSCYKA